MNTNGFSLFELLMVMLALVALVGIAIPRFMSTIERSRASEAYQFMAEVRKAQIAHYSSHSSFSTDFSTLGFSSGGGITVGTNTITALWDFVIKDSGTPEQRGRIEAYRIGAADSQTNELILYMNGNWGGNYIHIPPNE